MNSVELLGYFAGFLLLICDIPQLYKIHRTKSAKDISGLMVVLWCLGSFSMLSYVFLTQRGGPLLLTYTFTSTVSVIMLLLYLRHR